jgi:hypothetical protein
VCICRTGIVVEKMTLGGKPADILLVGWMGGVTATAVSGSYKFVVNTIGFYTCSAQCESRNKDPVRSLDILLVMENEVVAQAMLATLQRAGHRVTTSTTIAGTVETLMRRGRSVDIVITSTRLGHSLGDDVVQYSRALAANARLIVLREVDGGVEDLEAALARQGSPARARAVGGWN